MNSSERCWKIALAIAAVIGIALRVWLILATPCNAPPRALQLSAYNDETAHVAYTSYILQHSALPATATPITSWSYGESATFENYQSPLYYIVHAALCKVLGTDDETEVAHVGRWFALLMFCLLLLIAWKIGVQLNSDPSAIAMPSLFLLLLSGVFVRFSTLAGNEIAAWLMAGVLVLSYMQSRDSEKITPTLQTVLIFAVGLYVKLSLLVLAPLAIHVLWRLFPKRPGVVALIVTSTFIVLSPLAWRNLTHFGSLLPLGAGFGESGWRLFGVDSIAYLARSSVFPFSEFWQGWKGALLMAPALALQSFVLVAALRNWRQVPVVALCLALTVTAYLWLNSRYDQAEGRYLMIAWPVLLAGLGGLPSVLRSPWIQLAAFTSPYLLFVV